jgi:hypothetical protein
MTDDCKQLRRNLATYEEYDMNIGMSVRIALRSPSANKLRSLTMLGIIIGVMAAIACSYRSRRVAITASINSIGTNLLS